MLVQLSEAEVADGVSVFSLLSISTLQGSSTGCVNFDFSDYELWGEGILFFFRFNPIHPDSHTQSLPHTHKRLIRCFFQHCLKCSTCLFDFTCQVNNLLKCLHQ